jgi:hypothetical protein
MANLTSNVRRRLSWHLSGGAGALFWGTAQARSRYNSSMCSTAAERLARIGTAIDELAAAALPGAGEGQPSQPGQHDDIAGRLAQIWAMIAELDPELSKRLPGYLG